MNGEFRNLICVHCNKFITRTNVEQDIQVFCDPTCLNSYLCEQTAESKDEMLHAIEYANNREEVS